MTLPVVVTFVAVLTASLILIVAGRPSLLRRRGGRAVAFVVMFLLPVVVTAIGVQAHLERAKKTEFCLSCHEMEPYGTSMWVAEADRLAAVHAQNVLVPRETSCYTCHTNYTMFGDAKAKMNGMIHLWVHYFGEIPEEIELYEPYQNRECLHCHGGARGFEENEFHEGMVGEMMAGEISCLDCHAPVHDVHDLDPDVETWSPEYADGGAP